MSRSTKAARRGITLVEVLVAGGLGIMILTLAVRAYLGANKAQNIAIAAGVIKSYGQAALHDLYYKLHSSYVLFERGAKADAWLAKIPVSGVYTATGALTPGYVTTETRLAVLMAKPAFSTTATADGFATSKVGNALLFTTTEPDLTMREEPSGNELRTAFGTPEVHLTPFRLQFFVLAKRPNPLRAPAFKNGSTTNYQLMAWTSSPYIDYGDMLRWIKTCKAAGLTDAYIDAKLTKLRDGGFAGIMDTSATTSANVIRKLVARTSDHLDFDLETAPFVTHQYRAASKTSMSMQIGQIFISFNTTGTNALPLPNLDVPAFADDATTLPFGFETMMGGPVNTRQVLVRLAYTARTTPGNVMSSQTFQQVIQTFAEIPATAATPGATPAPPTPTPAPTGT